MGDEDHLGDMDFKVAGTKDGITSLQMDIKITGITFEIMEQALKQACFRACSMISNVIPVILISIWSEVIPSLVPATLKSISPKWSSSPKISDSTLKSSPSLIKLN